VSDALLDVSHLTIGFTTGSTATPVVRDVSFSVRPGQTLAIVGESGSGKSLTASAILRLVRPPGRILDGTVRFRGRDLLALGEHELRELRGADLALIAQEPMTSLNPVFTIGDQIAETLVVHGRAEWARARGMAVDLLQAVRMPEAARRVRDYPHQLSGGQQQRVLIAMALACKPALLIADEPTTALDVTIQAEILDLLRDIRAQSGLALVLITHDLGVVAEMADRVAVMYAGHIVEESPVAALFASPQHPYTRGLLASTPRKGIARRRLHTIDGVVPNPGALPPGCSFEPRCPERIPPCRTTDPPLYPLGGERAARCLLLEETTR
jgi:oligopeptide/dipeptide ABC transporter ATP-binding protein